MARDVVFVPFRVLRSSGEQVPGRVARRLAREGWTYDGAVAVVDEHGGKVRMAMMSRPGAAEPAGFAPSAGRRRAVNGALLDVSEIDSAVCPECGAGLSWSKSEESRSASCGKCGLGFEALPFTRMRVFVGRKAGGSRGGEGAE